MSFPFGMKNRSNAFTLIELLVVMVIIALLVSMLLSGMKYARQSTNELRCQTNLRSYGAAMQLYQNDNQGKFYTFPLQPQSLAFYQMTEDFLSSCWDAPPRTPGVRQQPWTCPFENQGFWQVAGTSYQYNVGIIEWQSRFYPSLGPPRSMASIVSNPGEPIFDDINSWHSRSSRNGAMADGSVVHLKW